MYIKNRLGLIESVETMLAQERRMDQIANNLANVDTSGFKKEKITFWEMLFTAQDKRPRVGKALNIITDGKQGSLKMTENPLDIAIEGEGFFRVQTDNGIRYTRNGNLNINDAGQLVTAGGYPVLGQGGIITVGNDMPTIGPKGDVLVNGQVIDALAVVSFDDFQLLEKEGTNFYRIPEGEQLEEQAPANLSIQQGYLETSNVNVTVELTEMIDLYRAFEAQQKLVHSVDELDGQAISRVGRLGE